jgi:hypothetical protein
MPPPFATANTSSAERGSTSFCLVGTMPLVSVQKVVDWLTHLSRAESL